MAAISLAAPSSARVGGLPLHTLEYIPHPLFEDPNAEALLEASRPSLPTVADAEMIGQDPSAIVKLCAAPMLNKEQERFLFTQMNYLKFRAAEISKSLTESTTKLASRTRKKREAEMNGFLAEALILRNTIVESNLRLVASIAKKYVTLSHNLEEAISEGFPPLIRAVELFDCSRGLAFSTYATHCVKNALGRASSRAEKRRKRQGHLSRELVSVVEDDRSPIVDPDPLISRWKTLAGSLLTHLNDREQTVITARFGLGDDQPHSYEQIGQLLKLSKERVRQICLAAIAKLQRVVEEESIEFPAASVMA